jgi:hypothetical protein
VAPKCYVRAAIVLAHLFAVRALEAETVRVRQAEGVVRGFLVLKSLDGALIASGDLIQTTKGDRVMSRLVLHFKDGSVQDETSVFTQTDRFRLVSDHMIQSGPSFPKPIDVSLDAAAGRVPVRYREDGKDKTIDTQMALPEDLANGIVLTLLKNIAPGTSPSSVSMLFATPKPRLANLVITRAGEDPFSSGGVGYKATRFNVKVELGGVAGVVAPLIGKRPHDTSVWILEGEAPGFIGSEGPMYESGPLWRMELASPSLPKRSLTPEPARTR